MVINKRACIHIMMTFRYVCLSLLMSYNLLFSQDSALIHRVRTIIQAKEYHTAISILDNYIRDNKDINKKYLGDLYSACGYCYQMLNIDTISIYYYRKAIENTTTIPYTYHQMAKYVSKTGNIDQALSLAKKCITLKPDYVQTWLLITEIYQKLNDSISWLSSCRRAAYLGDNNCHKLLSSIGDGLEWDVNEIQSEITKSDSPESSIVDDTLGFWGTSYITNYYSPGPPEFVPVDKPPIPIVSTKKIYSGIEDFIKDTTTINNNLDTINHRIPVPLVEQRPNDSTDIVLVKVLISKTGIVEKSFAFASSNSLFNDHACNKLKKWKFKSAMLDAKCYAVWVLVPIKIINP
ncbi:MAG: hypothetical protein HZB59_02320 [Ignavibacteriales bacterium]|nr:hypothetical protein [Ignavibacteriales bacterium]